MLYPALILQMQQLIMQMPPLTQGCSYMPGREQALCQDVKRLRENLADFTETFLGIENLYQDVTCNRSI